MLIKICGINSSDTAKSLEPFKIDMIGLVFVQNSPRFVSLEQAIRIKRALGTSTKIVAVFQNQPLDEVIKTATVLNADYVQLHGEESPSYCAELPFPVIKAISLGASIDKTEQKLNAYTNTTAYFLIDRKEQGKGPVVDSEQVKVLSRSYNILLSGGLTPDNILAVLDSVGTDIIGVDVSGGVEEAPGKKNMKKIKNYIEKVRSHNA